MIRNRTINCPEPCKLRVLTRFVEGVIIHTHHFDSLLNRRVLHEVFIPYEQLIHDQSKENLPSIETFQSKNELTRL